jgi:hypothetical protein
MGVSVFRIQLGFFMMASLSEAGLPIPLAMRGFHRNGIEMPLSSPQFLGRGHVGFGFPA